MRSLYSGYCMSNVSGNIYDQIGDTDKNDQGRVHDLKPPNDVPGFQRKAHFKQQGSPNVGVDHYFANNVDIGLLSCQPGSFCNQIGCIQQWQQGHYWDLEVRVSIKNDQNPNHYPSTGHSKDVEKRLEISFDSYSHVQNAPVASEMGLLQSASVLVQKNWAINRKEDHEHARDQSAHLRIYVLPCAPVILIRKHPRVIRKRAHDTNVQVWFHEELLLELLYAAPIVLLPDQAADPPGQGVIFELNTQPIHGFIKNHQEDKPKLDNNIWSRQQNPVLWLEIKAFKLLTVRLCFDKSKLRQHVLFCQVSENVHVGILYGNLQEKLSLGRIVDLTQWRVGDHLNRTHGAPEFVEHVFEEEALKEDATLNHP